MIRINLLPVRQLKKRQRIKSEIFIFSASLVLVLAILGGAGLFLGQKIANLKTDLITLEKKKKSYKPILNQIAKLQKDKKTLENKLTAIKKLQTGSQLTVRVLDEVAKQTPTDRMWLTSMSQSGSSVKLAGIALDNETIAQYMNALDSSPYLAKTNLSISKQSTTIASKKLKSFSLSVNIVTPPPMQ
jgi:type IV pilus assembly protein PilN